jgi:hypothetical protein
MAMVRLLYETLPRRRQLGQTVLPAGERVCRVWATGGPDELAAWGETHGMPPWALFRRPMPHYLLWGEVRHKAGQVGPGVEVADAKTWAADVAAWKRRVQMAREFAAALE